MGRRYGKMPTSPLMRGEFVAVIGPNGAGKTTMFRMLLGLQKPTSGTISVFNDQPRRGNSKIGYVPQRHTIDNETNIECMELVRLAYSGGSDGALAYLHVRKKRLLLMHCEAVGATELSTQIPCILVRRRTAEDIPGRGTRKQSRDAAA